MSVTLAVELGSALPLTGRVRLPDGSWQPFVGWAALAMLVGSAAEGLDEPEGSPAAQA